MAVTLEDRFWAKVEFGDWLECWPWAAGGTGGGYGAFWVDGETVAAHRVAYRLLVGPINDDVLLDHTCHNDDLVCLGGPTCPHRRCVNPLHLVPATHRENLLRSPHTQASINTAKTHCPRGHPYDESNTMTDKNGGRTCRECHRVKLRRLRARR